jgi:anti-sigma-K factor RskA
VATLLSPDVGTAALAATGQAPSARLFWNPSRHRVVMAVFRLPPAPAGRTYQLWAIAQGKPVSLGIFNTGPDGRLITQMGLPTGLTFELTAVTEEPAGGSPQPTQQPFLVGKVTPAD